MGRSDFPHGGEDARRGRIYLPTEWLAESGIEPAAFLARPEASDGVRHVIGKLLDHVVGDRRDAARGATALGIVRGCRIIRAHDVRGTRRVADVLQAVLEAD